MSKRKKMGMKAGTKVCHINFPDICLYGTIIEDTKKGYPAILKVESKMESYQCHAIAYRASKLRECTKEDMLLMAIDKLKRSAQ